MSYEQYTSIIDQFQRRHVLVIGDLILDAYLRGMSTRLSPEAPVPVVDIVEKKNLPGGSANTACNLKKLGAQVTYCTAVGNDPAGNTAIEMMHRLGIDTSTIVPCEKRETVVKSRIVSGSQIITRFDTGTSLPIDPDTAKRLITKIKGCYSRCDAIILSDYNKGTLTEEVLEAIRELREKEFRFLAVDSKRLAFFARLKPDFVKPNYDEAIELLQVRPVFHNRSDQLKKYGASLLDITQAHSAAITLDKEGSLIFKNGKYEYHAQAPSIASPQVAGAGDTYISAFVLAHSISEHISACADIATAAATIVTRKDSTSSCSAAELKNYFTSSRNIYSFRELEQVCENYRTLGKKIVFTNGCFDILHIGHITYLHRAKELGDVLIVGVNTDESIRRLKGKDRPVNPLEERMQVLAGLSSVDHVVPFGTSEDDTPIPVLSYVRPDFFVKGGDYSKDELPEAGTVERLGGEVVLLPHLPDHSTTLLIKKIHSAFVSEGVL